MRVLLTQYFNIAFLMEKPQELPAGESQMRVGIALAFVTYVMAMSLHLGLFKATLQALIDLLGTALIMWVALRQTDRLGRMQQAFGGLCGASAFINLASLPIVAFRPPQTEATSGVLAEFVLLVWSLSLLAFIIRHTFEIKMFVSILIAYVYVVIWSTIISTLLPAPLAAPSSELSNVLFESITNKIFIVSYTPSFGSLSAIEVVASSVTVL